MYTSLNKFYVILISDHTETNFYLLWKNQRNHNAIYSSWKFIPPHCLVEQVEVPKKKRGKSLYAKATDTGINPEVAAKRLNIDWDAAANIEDSDVTDDAEVPSAVVCFCSSN